MVIAGELAFSIDTRPVVVGMQRMRRELRGFAKDARDASGAFAPGGGSGRFGTRSGRIPGPGGGGRLRFLHP